jgi:hypothetical protein
MIAGALVMAVGTIPGFVHSLGADRQPSPRRRR